MTTPRERAEALMKEYTYKRSQQIADTMVCASIGVEDLEEQNYWETVFDNIQDIRREQLTSS